MQMSIIKLNFCLKTSSSQCFYLLKKKTLQATTLYAVICLSGRDVDIFLYRGHKKHVREVTYFSHLLHLL
jgi:hypothetical protein